ncbi:hypothetical protein PL743_21235 [Phocaeicola vulgatus]|nr:hypothetical protein [Phocaeicola vulgatus]MDB1085900.1 hypothetical protein [Phocaeicola vulgatus]
MSATEVTPCQSPSTVARVDGAACGVASTDSPVARMTTGYSPSGRRLSSASSSCVQAARPSSRAMAADVWMVARFMMRVV